MTRHGTSLAGMAAFVVLAFALIRILGMAGRQGSQVTPQQERASGDLPRRTTSFFFALAGNGDGRTEGAPANLSHDYRKSHLELEEIPPDASPAVVDGILGRLAMEDASAFPGMSKAEVRALRNDTLNALLRQKTHPPQLVSFLIGQVSDEAMDPVWRDYCLQHLADCFRQLPEESPARAEIVSALLHAASDLTSPMAGTALLGLDAVAARDSFEFALSEAVKSARTCAPTRITAVRLAGHHRLVALLPDVRRFAADAGTAVLIRLAAIASLGEMGDGEDAALLEELSNAGGERVGQAAASALARLAKSLD